MEWHKLALNVARSVLFLLNSLAARSRFSINFCTTGWFLKKCRLFESKMIFTMFQARVKNNVCYRSLCTAAHSHTSSLDSEHAWAHVKAASTHLRRFIAVVFLVVVDAARGFGLWCRAAAVAGQHQALQQTVVVLVSVIALIVLIQQRQQPCCASTALQ